MSNSSKSLKRSLSLPTLCVYGAGTILGAGIYVLVGEVVGEAGLYAPLAFLLAAFVASFTALSYGELSSRMPDAGGPAEYARQSFDSKWLPIVVGWAIVATGLISASTILTGFVGYLHVFVDLPSWLIIVVSALVLGFVAAIGVETSAKFMTATTLAGVAGLLYVVYAGVGEIDKLDTLMNSAPSLADGATLFGIGSAAFLAFYSFIGFEDMVHMAEEAEEPTKNLPRAIIVAIVVSTVLYVVVVGASLLVVSPEVMSKSDAPLVEVVKTAGLPEWPLAALSLWIILNGALAQVIMASRVIYGLGKRNGSPRWLSKINDKTETPVTATIACTVVIATFALLLPLKTLAQVTSFIMLAVFLVSNLALIKLEKREPEAPFDTWKIVPWIGAVMCSLLMAYQLFSPTGH
jgi:basic amino acid/polyamine antiporter, APA family